jgi:hypothetical protein
LIDIPDLVRVDHEPTLGPDLFAYDAQAPDIVVEAGADLQFDVIPTLDDRFAA